MERPWSDYLALIASHPAGMDTPPGVSLVYLGKQGAQPPDVMGTNSKLINFACYAATTPPPSAPLLVHAYNHHLWPGKHRELERALHNRLAPHNLIQPR